MHDVVLESIRAGGLAGVLGYLWVASRRRPKPAGWPRRLVLTGLAMVVFGSLLDVTDNFTSLDRYVVIGRTVTEAYLEEFVGYLGGGAVLTVGLLGWILAAAGAKDMGTSPDRLKEADAASRAGPPEQGRESAIDTLAQVQAARVAAETSNQELEAANRQLEQAMHRANEMAAEAARASAAKSDFLANMSHEVRTPLNGIVGTAELLGHTRLTGRQVRYVRTIRRSAGELTVLLNDVLDLSRIEAGKLEMVSEQFNLRTVAEDVAQLVAPTAGRKGVEVIVRHDADAPEWVSGDAGRIRQVLLNLLGNAVKFTEEGWVLLDVRCTERHDRRALFEMAVQDTGIGIAPDKLDAVFEKFAQADSSTTRRFGGSGLGLTISRRLVELMGGVIWVESRLGHGSTFRFTVPLDLADGASPAGARSAELESLEGLRVLIADDSPVTRRVLSEAVSQWKMAPSVAESGPACLDLLDQARRADQPFDLAVLDAAMPEPNGFDIAARITPEACPPGRTVIMLPAGSNGPEVDRADESRVAACLVKPVRQAELLEAVLVALGRRRATPGTPADGAGERSNRPIRILLAEDNPVNQEVAVELLETMGHTVVVAENGIEALALLESGPFDLAFIDMQMPKMSGLEAVAEIRRREGTTGRHMPLVAMTAHAMEGDRQRCLDAGMDDYVSKPISEARLREAMDRVLASAAPGCLAPDGADPSEPDRESVIDYPALLHRCMGKASTLKRVLGRFEPVASDLFEQIEQALAASRTEEAASLAHSLKGAAATISAEPLRAAAERMERLCLSGAEAAALSCLPELQLELRRCMEQVPHVLTRAEAASAPQVARV